MARYREFTSLHAVWDARMDDALYQQRTLDEIVYSTIKRRLGSAVATRTWWKQFREIVVKCIAHNLEKAVSSPVPLRNQYTPVTQVHTIHPQLLTKLKKDFNKAFIGETRVAVFLAMKLKVFSNPRHPFIVYLPFVCRQCGACCKQLGTTWKASDIKRAATFLQISPRAFVEKYLGHTFDTMKEEASFKYEIDLANTQPCPFLTGENKCSIYPVRPYGCKMYPLLNDGGSRIVCPAYEHLKDAITVMIQGVPMMKQPIVAGSPLFPIHSPEDLKMRENTDWTKQRVWESYLRTKPNEQEKHMFKRWNFKKKRQKTDQSTLFQ